MTLIIKHRFQSKKPDPRDPTLIKPSDWNDGHQLLLNGPALVGNAYPGTNMATEIALGAGLSLVGNVLTLDDIAASLRYVGEWPWHPTEQDLGTEWAQNAVYKNATDDISYVLTGNPLAWQKYLSSGAAYTLTVESSNGTVFRVGHGTTTQIRARVFRNGAEITQDVPSAWFKWQRVSMLPQPYPNDDYTWNSLHLAGPREFAITVDDVSARATFKCEIVSP